MYYMKTSKLLFFIIFSLAMLFPSGIHAGDTSSSFHKSSVIMNPSFKLKRLSNGTVILSSTEKSGTIVKHEFRDLYADLVMAVYRKQRMTVILNNLANKYYLSEDDCRREVKHALNELAEWRIVIIDDKTH